METNCIACKLLGELYDQVEQTDRNYYVVTELFVLLHGGKDFCNPEVQDSELDKMIDRRRARFEIGE